MQWIKLGFTAHVSSFIGAALGTIIMPVFLACAQAQPTNLAVTVRHAPSLNGNGRIEGSLQQLLGENATLNGGFTLTGDLLVPGTPTLRVNGNPTFAGTIAGTGGTSPAGYQITLNGNCSLRYMTRRGVLDEGMVWNSFSWWFEPYYLAVRGSPDLIAEARSRTKAPSLFREIEWLNGRMQEISMREDKRSPPANDVLEMLTEEVKLAEPAANVASPRC
jgi:hypothetical protein